MCAATRYPEAVPLRTLKAQVVLKEIVKFCTTFGLPRVIQTDQGTNFTSKVFEQLLKELGVSHKLSSAYHPESQGVLECFHQTLKTLLRTFCTETGKDWVDGLPLFMFAVRGSVQESLGFAHTVRGPLNLLKEQFTGKESAPMSVLDYVSSFHERLHKACSLAKSHLAVTQCDMKERYDRKAIQRSFQAGESVLVFLPVPGSPLQAKFSGPYTVEQKLSETDYVIATPERRRKTRVCHINMLKPYVMRDVTASMKSVDKCKPCVTVNNVPVVAEEMFFEEPQSPGVRLNNSIILGNIESHLSYLPKDQLNEVVNLLRKYPSLFSDLPGRTTVLSHDIDVGNSTPIKQHPYRVNPVKRDIMRSEVDYLLQNNLAVHSQSPWSSPCLLVPKPDSTFRFCTDYRKVNSITKPDSFPLPRMEDCVDKVGAAKYVTKLDLLKGYWQVPLTTRACEISAFVTPDNFLQYNCMAFGMRNAPATFQRLMQKVLSGLCNCEAYLDDIVVYSCNWEDHLTNLERVFERLCSANLTLNLAKCEFAKAVVTYLGKKVGQGCVRPVTAKVIAVTEFPSPLTKRQLHRFLGMAGYYRGFCKNFATVVSPLTDLLSTERKFVWNSQCENAFIAVKDLLCNAPILSAPNFSLPFKLQIDASAVGAGAVLVQEDDTGVEHPVCYFSKKFSKCQRNYSTIEKEALALVLSLKHFEVYVGGSCVPLVVFTDHNPLVFLSRMCNLNQRLMRWSLFLQEYNLDIHHKKGVENVVADALSRACEFDVGD
uniref:ribonuclease H n=1 Tax=Denticeps clupeoides TaxID=299321 RepID=A0AAY4E6M7_9TELE